MSDPHPPGHFARVKEILLGVADLDPEQRASYLDDACGDDAGLRDEVDRLLAEDSDSSSFMATGNLGGAPPTAVSGSTDSEALPDTIARYKILRVLGQGGMGIVYEAEQSTPRRKVALKVVRTGHLADDTSVKLFQREAESLGRLRHPGIAAIHESGQTETGQHYFAMELVPGMPLDAYLARALREDATRDGLHRRLTLFRSICEAVHYAHQRGVIHRDLKPSNIMVDEEGRPKILDFGLARITDADAGLSLVTEVGAIRGTLAYMSPEQARGRPDQIDARTDVYSLGVILYEILAGVRPYDLGREPIVEAIRIICEEPPRPLTRARTGGPKLDPDLQTIVGKALEKDADRRYVTANALGDDVDRFLSSRPILARAPGIAYRTRKLVRRNRILVGSALATTIALVAGGLVATILALAAGIVVTSVLAVRASRARRAAIREARTAARVSGFLTDLFKSPTPGKMRDTELTAKEVIDAGAQRLMTDLTEEPQVRAELLTVIGGVYTSLGQFESAEPLLQEALTVLDQTPDADPAKLAMSLDALASNYQERGRTAESIPLARRAVAIADEVGDEGLRANMRITFGNTRNANRDYEGAEEVFREVIRIYESTPHAPGRKLSTCYLNIANNRLLRNDFETAKEMYHRALALDERDLGPGHFRVATLLHNLALISAEEGSHEEGWALEQRSLTIRENVLGPDHWHVALSVSNLARIALLRGELDQAETLIRRAIAIDEAQFEAAKFEIANDVDLLAAVLVKKGRLDEAEVHARRATEVFTAIQEPMSETLGWIQLARGQIDEAETTFRAVLGTATEGGWFSTIANAHAGVAEVADRRGEPATALAAIDRALEVVSGRWVEDHPRRRELLDHRRRLEAGADGAPSSG